MSFLLGARSTIRRVVARNAFANVRERSAAPLAAVATPLVNSPPSSAQYSSSTPATPGFYEMVTETILPQHVPEYFELQATNPAHKHSLLGFFSTDLGGSPNQVRALHHFRDLDHRDELRAAAAADPHCAAVARQLAGLVQTAHSMAFLEAADCHEAAGAPSPALFAPPPAVCGAGPVYELRTYQLQLGYKTVPTMCAHIAAGLPSKVAADTEGKLAMYAFSDFGMLNNVIEIWRYPSAQACLDARQAARKAQAWRDAVGNVTPMVVTFETQLLRPAPFSPWS